MRRACRVLRALNPAYFIKDIYNASNPQRRALSAQLGPVIPRQTSAIAEWRRVR